MEFTVFLGRGGSVSKMFDSSPKSVAVKLEDRHNSTYIPEEQWEDVDSIGDISITRMRYLPHGWSHAKDLVIIRKRFF